MRTRLAASVACLSACLLAAPLGAQQLGIGLLAGQVTNAQGETAPGATINAGLGWTDGWTTVLAGSELMLPQADGYVAGGTLRVSTKLPRRGPTAAVEAEASARSAASSGFAYGVHLSPRIGYDAGGWSLMAGPRVGIVGRTSSEPEGMGGWLLPGGFSTTVDADPRAVTGAAADFSGRAGKWSWSTFAGASRLGEVTWRDAGGQVAVSLGRLAASAGGGLRSGGVSESWAALSAAVRVVPGVAIVARAGRYAPDPVSGGIPGTRAGIGLELTTGS